MLRHRFKATSGAGTDDASPQRLAATQKDGRSDCYTLTVSCRSIQGARWFLEHQGQDPNNIKSKDGENCLARRPRLAGNAVDFGCQRQGWCKLSAAVDHDAPRLTRRTEQQRCTPLARAQEKKHKKAIAFLEAAGAKA